MSEGRDYDDESSADAMTRPDSHGEAAARLPTIALAMPWCPWIPERVESTARLKASLGIEPLGDAEGPVEARAFGEKLPNDQWSEQVFEWLAATQADICVQIQDDAEVSPDFWAIVRALFVAVPEAEIFGLHVPNPLTPALAEEGIRVFTTADAVIGVSWAMRGPVMREFVEWRRSQLVDGWREPTPPRGAPGVTEDTMIGLFAMSTGRLVYHPVIAPVDHDTSIASTYENDDAANRSAHVTWRSPGIPTLTIARMKEAIFWTESRIPHLGRFYEATPHLARRWVKGFDEEAFMRAQRDQGNVEKRRLRHAVLARSPQPTIASVMICMPVRDRVDPATMQTVWQTLRDEGIDASCSHDVWAVSLRTENLVRGRSRMLREAYESGADAAWFLDSDVSCSPHVLRGLVRALQGGKDIVAAPYPRRDILALQNVTRAPALGVPPGALAYHYRVDFGGNEIRPDASGCVRIVSTGLGCTLISRKAIRIMTDFYGDREDLVFDDPIEDRGPKVPTVALFQLMVRDRALHGEDSSFYLRAIDAGIQPWIYLGQGAPAVHHGEHAYAGDIEAFGVKHVREAE